MNIFLNLRKQNALIVVYAACNIRELLKISISRLATETKAEFTNVNEHFVEKA
jgi:hypothetical protein